MNSRRTPVKVSGLVSMGRLVPSEMGAAPPSPGETNPEASKRSEIPALRPSGRGTVFIPLSLLRIHPYNSRRTHDAARIAEIAESLRNDGQKEPIEVIPGRGDDAGCFLIPSGGTRFHAAPLAGLAELEAFVNDGVDVDDALAITKLSRTHNNTRSESDLDQALVVQDLEAKGFSNEQIRAAMDYGHVRSIRRLRAFAELPKGVIELARNRPPLLTATAAERLRNVLNEVTVRDDALMEAVERFLEPANDMTVSQLEAAVRAAARTGPAGSRRRATRVSTKSISFDDLVAGKLNVLTPPGNDKQREYKLDLTLPIAAGDAFEKALTDFIRSHQGDIK